MPFFVKFFAFLMFWAVGLDVALDSSIMQMEYRTPILMFILFAPLIWGVFALRNYIDGVMEEENK